MPIETKTQTGTPKKKLDDQRFRIATLSGFPIYLHWTFVILIFFLFRVPETAIVLTISILIHELAHAISCRYLGFGSGDITLWVLGGFFIPHELKQLPYLMEREDRMRYALMILAGPLSNIMLAIIGYVLGLLYSPELFTYFIHLNLILAVFNLLPIPPLDGEKIFVMYGQNYLPRQRLHLILGFLMLGLSLAGIYATIQFDVLDPYSNWPIYIFIGAGHAFRLAQKTDEELDREYREEVLGEIFPVEIVELGIVGKVSVNKFRLPVPIIDLLNFRSDGIHYKKLTDRIGLPQAASQTKFGILLIFPSESEENPHKVLFNETTGKIEVVSIFNVKNSISRRKLVINYGSPDLIALPSKHQHWWIAGQGIAFTNEPGEKEKVSYIQRFSPALSLDAYTAAEGFRQITFAKVTYKAVNA